MGSKWQSGIGKESRAAVWGLLRNYPLAGQWKRNSIAEGVSSSNKDNRGSSMLHNEVAGPEP